MRKKPREVEVFDMIVEGIGKILSRPFRKIFSPRKFSLTEIEDEFKRLEAIMKLGGESNLRQAIVEADNFLDKVLKGQSAQGKTMGERLKDLEKSFSKASYQVAWEAHKIRNRIVHEHRFQLLTHDAQRALANFKKAICNLL